MYMKGTKRVGERRRSDSFRRWYLCRAPLSCLLSSRSHSEEEDLPHGDYLQRKTQTFLYNVIFHMRHKSGCKFNSVHSHAPASTPVFSAPFLCFCELPPSLPRPPPPPRKTAMLSVTLLVLDDFIAFRRRLHPRGRKFTSAAVRLFQLACQPLSHIAPFPSTPSLKRAALANTIAPLWQHQAAGMTLYYYSLATHRLSSRNIK